MLIHGMKGTRTYRSWLGMKSRCNNKNKKQYKDYGGRGISYCKKWDNFVSFLEDMGVAPDNHTLDRIDNNKGYYRENCRWSTRKEQARNRRTKRILVYKGIKKSLIEWSEEYNIPTPLLHQRLKYGWTVHDAFNVRPQHKGYNTRGYSE